jgi:hypothetical protein
VVLTFGITYEIAMHNLKDNIKETFYSIAEIPSSSIQELAEFIQHYPENTYTFSRLNMKDSHFYLETRPDRVLQLDGYSNRKKFLFPIDPIGI